MGPSWLGGGAGAPRPWPLGSAWARASRTSSGLYLLEPPGQVQLIPPEKLHGQIPVLTSFSVTLITVRQKLGEATALRDPQVTTPKGKRLDHDGQGRRVRHSPQCEDRLLKPSTPLPAPAASPAVTVWASIPWPSPALCLQPLPRAARPIPAHPSGIGWNASSGKLLTPPGTPAPSL